MDFEDIADAMRELREDNYDAEELVVGPEAYHDLVSDANFATATKPSSMHGGGSIGKVAGADVTLEDISIPLLKGQGGNHTRAVPVLESGGFVHENINGHHLVESHEIISCINCEKELTGLVEPEMRRWAHGYFLSNRCPEPNRKI